MSLFVSEERKEAELRAALFRVRALLALHDHTAHHQLGSAETNAALMAPSPSPPARAAVRSRSVSLHSIDLEDESADDTSHDEETSAGMNGDVIGGANREEDPAVRQILPLPSLHWPSPTLHQRLLTIEKRKMRRQKRKERVQQHIRSSSAPLVAVGGPDERKNKEDVLPARSSSHFSSSSLTLTGNHSDKSGSQDTYAMSHVSIDDVYIHELARELGSSRTHSSALHRYRASSSANVCGTHRSLLMSSSRNDMGGIGLSSENTVIAAQGEFDRIGKGEEAPYTSYLFSPDVRVIDLSSHHLSVSEVHRSNDSRECASSAGKNDGEKRTGVDYSVQHTEKQARSDTGAAKYGCTKVCFSPQGNCYVIGTLLGELWFVHVNTQALNNTETSAGSPVLLQGHSGAVMDVAFDEVGTFFASGGEDACVIIWDQRTRLKVRRINTDGGIPSTVHFMPKNNNYLLVSIPQHHLLRLYNSSTGLPVTRKGPVMRVQATAVAVGASANPFFFIGDVRGTITMWRCCVSSDDDDVVPAVVAARRGGKERPATSLFSLPPSRLRWPPSAARHSAANTGREKQRQRQNSAKAEGQPHFEKIASLAAGTRAPVGTLAVSPMNHQQFHSLLLAQDVGQKVPESNSVKKWAVAALTATQQRHEHLVLSSRAEKSFARSACAVMLLASFPCDRLELICVEFSNSVLREYKLVPMLVINGACRIRQMLAGAAFCPDNVRSPTVSCTCEEGFVHIITCAGRHVWSLRGEGAKGSGAAAKQPRWNVMATLHMPCGGIPVSLAWSPDMRLLVAVTEEGTLYEWRRVYIHHNTHNQCCPSHRDGDDNCPDDDDSSAGRRAQDEVDEWQMYFQRERQRQMRQYHAERSACDSSDNSLSGSESWWTQGGGSATQSLTRSHRRNRNK